MSLRISYTHGCHCGTWGCPALIFAPAVSRKLQQEFAAPTIRFENEPPYLGQVSKECDVAILNGTHNTTASLLLAGKPMLQLPEFLEQFEQRADRRQRPIR